MHKLSMRGSMHELKEHGHKEHAHPESACKSKRKQACTPTEQTGAGLHTEHEQEGMSTHHVPWASSTQGGRGGLGEGILRNPTHKCLETGMLQAHARSTCAALTGPEVGKRKHEH